MSHINTSLAKATNMYNKNVDNNQAHNFCPEKQKFVQNFLDKSFLIQ